ncbi:MAG: PH domain-containing protein [Planctomycetota bacterium]
MPQRFVVDGVDQDSNPVRKYVEAESLADAEAAVANAGVTVHSIARTGTAPVPAAMSGHPGGTGDASDSAQPGVEQTLWDGTPSQWPNLWRYLLIITIPWALWVALVIANTRITLTSQRLRIRRGVFSTAIEEIELYRVHDSAMTQSFIQRLFALGTVHLQTHDASLPHVYLDNIASAFQLRETIRQAVERVRRVQKVREIDLS